MHHQGSSRRILAWTKVGTALFICCVFACGGSEFSAISANDEDSGDSLADAQGLRGSGGSSNVDAASLDDGSESAGSTATDRTAGGSLPPPTGVQLSAALTATTQQAPTPHPTPFNDVCPPNQAVIGYAGTVNGAGMTDAGPSSLRSFQAICGTFSVTVVGRASYQITTTQAGTLPPRGTPGAMPLSSMCPPNQVVVGFAGKSGGLIDALAFTCAQMMISVGPSGYTLSVGPQSAISPLGGSSGTSFTVISCPVGQVAVGDAGFADSYANSYIGAFGLLCAMPTLVVP